jgi:hypothetical protein
MGELQPGTYEVEATHPGFAPYRHKGLVLLIGRSIQFDIVLQPATAQAQINVTAQPDAMEPTQTTMALNIETERIEELPVQSRNYLNFVLLAPGVTSSPTSQFLPGSQATAGLGDSGFSFGGLRGRSNNIAIDGVDNNDEFNGSSRTELSLEIVREFQVVNTGIFAESGGASGGSINVVTKSGTNIAHGDAFLFLENAATSARDPLSDAGEHPDFNRYRAGLAVGGPVRKNRIFYYLAGEQEHNREQQASDIESSAISAVNSSLATGAIPGLHTRALTSGLFNTSRAETELSGKLDHSLRLNHNLMLRYSYANNREAGDAFNTSSLVDQSARGNSFTQDHALVGSLASVITPKSVNDLRFQIATRHVVLRTNETGGTGIDIAGMALFGRPYGGNGNRRENHYLVSDVYSKSLETHLLKIGLTVNHVTEDADVGDGFGGWYVFSGLEDFIAGRPQFWIQSFGGTRTRFGVTGYGGFVQDHWSPRWAKNLTIDAGLRFDFESLPGAFPEDFNNFSPRLGIAFSPSKAWVIRGAYGVYFDRYVLAFLNRAVEFDGRAAFQQVAQGDKATSVFESTGGDIGAPIPSVAPSIYGVEQSLATPYSQQVSAAVERLITTNTTISATYQRVRGIKLPRSSNVNLLPPVILTPQNSASLGIANPVPQQIGRDLFGPGRINPQFDNIYQGQNHATSTYNGFSLAVNHRLANEIAFSASYTLSKTIDDASEFDEQPQNPYNLAAERSWSRNDQRHRLVFSGLFDLPFGEEEDRKPGSKGSWGDAILRNIEFAPILSVAGGKGVNPIVGFDANLSGAFGFSSRPLGNARNSLPLSRYVNLDVRLVKYFNVKPHGRLDFVVEMFNVFNGSNVVAINNVYGPALEPTSTFGQPVQLLRPRQAQFSIDFEF